MTINLNSGNPQKNQGRALLALVASIMAVGTAAHAQSGSENLASFGTLGQLNTAVTGYANGTACAPASVADGLIYLNNVFGPGTFSSSPNSYTALNTLATDMGTTSGGTAFGSEVSGLQTYISTSPKVDIAGGQYGSGLAGPAVPSSLSSIVKSATPTAQFLAGGLNAQQAVTVWIQFGTYSGGVFTAAGGIHSVTLNSISDTGGSGSVAFVDPWGTGTSSATAAATEKTATLTTEADGYLYLTGFSSGGSYSDEPAGTYTPAGELPGEAGGPPPPGGWSGRIVADLDEAVVPEPATYIAGALLLLPLGLTFFRKSPKLAKAVVK
jgi:hypothetical protein